MKLTQSTIFHTQNGAKSEVAKYILKIVSSPENNPDYLEIGTEDKQSIGIKQIKELIAWLQTRPYQEENKLAVIIEAEKMTLESQNSLLKVLEEPPARSYIFLITRNPRSLLQTVQSRTNIIQLNNGQDNGVHPETPAQSILKQDLKEQLSKIEEFLKIKDSKTRKDEIRIFLQDIHLLITNSDNTKENRKHNLKLIQQTERALNANANTKLVLENLFFNFEAI